MSGLQTAAPPGIAAAKEVFGTFATGVMVMAVNVGSGAVHAMTLNAFASVSLDPLLVLACVNRGAGMHGLISPGVGFCLTVLGDGQDDAMWHFASPDRPAGHAQFEGFPTAPSPVTGSPVLSDGLAFLDCTVHAIHPSGDHSIVVGAVRAAGLLAPEGDPLVVYRRRRLAAQGIPPTPAPDVVTVAAPEPDGRSATDDKHED